MNCRTFRLTGLFAASALLGGLLLFGGPGDAQARMTGGQAWTPAAQSIGANQAGSGQGYGYGHRQGHSGGMHGYGYTRSNTSAGYHNGHGPHDGPYQGCGW